jgi:hypothetical protein
MRGSARSLHAEVELLADELKELAGWGVEPNRLARKHVLSKLAGIEPSLRAYTAGCIIARYLVESIEALPEGLYEYDGRRYTASTLKAGFYLELRIGTTATHPDRQFRLMLLLGLGYSYDQWRKHPRLERGFLRILAEHMVKRANGQTTDQTA